MEIKKSIIKKENLLGLGLWGEFVSGERYEVLVGVVGKYDDKYTKSAMLSSWFDSYNCDRFTLHTLYPYQRCNYNLLKLA